MSFFFNYIVPFIIALGVLILVHELGHYLVARWCGVKVLRFSIGFGRPLLKYRGTSETEWVLAAFPLGGYVKMLGEGDDEVEEHELHRAFNRKPVGKRFAIVAAGPIANLLLAVALYWGGFLGDRVEVMPLIAPTEAEASSARAAGVRDGDLVLSANGSKIRNWEDLQWVLMRGALGRNDVRLQVRTHSGEDAVRILDLRDFTIKRKEDMVLRMGLQPASVPALIEYVEEGGAAAKAGMVKGDEIIAIDDEAVSANREAVKAVRAMPGQTRMFTVRRGGEELTLSVDVGERTEVDGSTVGIIGVRFDHSLLFAKVSYGPLDALTRAVRRTWDVSTLTLIGIGQMILGNISPREGVSGPITIADYAGKSAQHGPAAFIGFLAFISISLGILNLLPIPVLDGGHLLYYAVEFIKGSALSDRVVELGQKIGVALLLMLMAFALYNDINGLFS